MYSPAVYRVADKLTGADHDGEERQEEHGPHMVDPVHPVVVGRSLELLQRGHAPDNAAQRPGEETQRGMKTCVQICIICQLREKLS